MSLSVFLQAKRPGLHGNRSLRSENVKTDYCTIVVFLLAKRPVPVKTRKDRVFTFGVFTFGERKDCCTTVVFLLAKRPVPVKTRKDREPSVPVKTRSLRSGNCCTTIART